MDDGSEISIDMTTDERSVMMDEPDVAGHILSAAARATLLSAAPHPGGIEAWWCTCSIQVTRELLAWAEAGGARWTGLDPVKSAVFSRAARQVRFALWKVGAGPAP